MAFLLDTGTKAPHHAGARRSGARDAGPVIIALDPSDPSRNGMRRLRRALAKRCGLKHPNLVRTRVIGEGDGRIFLAFEHAQERSLRDVAAVKPFEPARAARVLEGVAAGVSALGRSGLGAWDLTPDRVLIHANQGARLMTVGVPSALIRPTSREHRGGVEDAGGEVCLLGSILFTALTGATPEAAPGTGTRHRRSGGAPRPSRLRPELSAEVDAVVMRAFSSDPADRFADARALTSAFSAAVGTAPDRPKARVRSKQTHPQPKPDPRRADDGPTVVVTQRNDALRKVIFATVLIALSTAAGLAVAREFQPDQAPSSITRAGVTIGLPEGWQEGQAVLRGTVLRSPIAATPAGKATAGLVIGKLGSEAAAERTIARSESDGEQVQLGDLYALRYQGLRPRPGLTGTGYVVPIHDGAVLVLCHASPRARTQLAECEAAAATLVVRGAQQRGPLEVHGWKDRLAGVMTELRARRNEGRRRLANAERPAGQTLAAGALERSHDRAARSVDRIASLENKPSLMNLAAALSATADAYARLAAASEGSKAAAYDDARNDVVSREKAVEAELARLGAA
jgi:hypothetical protein